MAEKARVVRTLCWEQWRQHRVLLGALLLWNGLVAVLGHAYIVGLVRPDFIDLWNTPYAVLWAPATVVLVLSIVWNARGDMRVDLPRRHFTLPVGTAWLVLPPLLFRLLAACLIGTSLGLVQDYCFVTDPAEWWVPIAYCCAVVVCGQLFAASLTAYGTAWALFAAFTATSVVGGLFLSAGDAKLMHGAWGQPLVLALWVGLILAGTACCHLITRHARHGDGTPLNRQLAGLREAADERIGNSMLAAQVWLEWRHTMRWCFWAALAWSVPMVIIMVMEPRETVGLEWAGFAMAGAWVFGLRLIYPGASYARFVFSRPISTHTVAFAKIMAGTRALFVAFMVSIPAIYLDTSGEPWVRLAAAAGITAAVWLSLLAGRLISAFMALFVGLIVPANYLALLVPNGPWLLQYIEFPLLTLVPVALLVITNYRTPRDRRRIGLGLLGVAAYVGFLLLGLPWREALFVGPIAACSGLVLLSLTGWAVRRGVIQPATEWRILGLWAVPAQLHLLVLMASEERSKTGVELAINGPVIWAMVLAVFVWVPLAMHLQRHR